MNPGAARATTLRRWYKARRELERLGIHTKEHVTGGPGEAVEVTRRALSDGVRRVVSVGGDGTLNEVVNGYLDPSGQPTNPDAVIGILPSGTGGDFRKSLGIQNLTQAIEALAGNATRLVDAGTATLCDDEGRKVSRHFINMASFGFGGQVVNIVNRWRYSLPWWVGGRVRFLAAAIRALDRYRNVDVRIGLDEKPDLAISTNLFVVGNGQFAGGGMMLAPNARMDDGLFDVLLVNGATRLDVLKELPRIRDGRHLKNPKVGEARASKVSIISSERMPVDLDGESAGFTPAHLAVLPSTVRICVPDSQ